MFSKLVWNDNQEWGEQHKYQMTIFFQAFEKFMKHWVCLKHISKINFLFSILVWNENQECGEQYNNFVECEGGGVCRKHIFE